MSMDQEPGATPLQESVSLEEQLKLIRGERAKIEGITDYDEAIMLLGWDVEGDDSGRTADELRSLLDDQIAETQAEIQATADLDDSIDSSN